MTTDVSAPSQNRPIQVFTAGGTIDKIYFDGASEYEVGHSVLDQLLRDARVAVGFDVVELLRKDSLELTDEDRALIRAAVAATPCERVVITHGTDTMTDTAAVLADVPDKVMVLTGSFAPARFAATDAAFNVGMAFAAVQVLGPGIYIAMSGQIFDAARVRKDRSLMQFVPL